MALFTPTQSPAVVVKEIDLTAGVPNVQSSTGAYVGRFRWGPVDEPRLVANEQGLIDVFASPDDAHSIDFHNASYFLRYSNSMQVVRMHNGANNAHSGDSATLALTIDNLDDFEASLSALDSDNVGIVGKYPGALGNSLKVETFAANDAGSTSDFASWPFQNNFDAAPGTSATATADGASHDEVHVAIVDEDGAFTGTKGSVLEVFPFLSVAENAKNTDGTTNYIKDVINNRSGYVWIADITQLGLGTAAGTATGANKNYGTGRVAQRVQTSLNDGDDGAALTTANVATGFDRFEDPDIIEVDFLIAPGMLSSADQVTVVNDLVATASSLRKDCVAVTSPNRTAVVNNAGGAVAAVSTAVANFTKSSYLVVDNNYLKVYDKFNDKFIHIPAASSTAGIMAATDRNFAPFFSPAGSRRGQYLGVTALAYNPNKSDRDAHYKIGVNPVANLPGQGILLFGDKTHQDRPSAFDRINVRRLFLVIERAISTAAKATIFEFNDEFTRSEFVGIIEPVLRNIQGRRGITDFKVVCDDTNNGPEIVDTNQFVANVFIKPARSINFITLNFVGVRSGVAFSEVVGTV